MKILLAGAPQKTKRRHTPAARTADAIIHL